MDDRELLELAAKAAGLPECGWMGPAFMYVKDNTFTDWDPLTDDGDALRLAVKLRMRVNISGAMVLVVYYTALGADGLHEQFGQDATSATRRAIVRAAAEIGKEMK